jgi:hypothetical protein
MNKLIFSLTLVFSTVTTQATTVTETDRELCRIVVNGVENNVKTFSAAQRTSIYGSYFTNFVKEMSGIEQKKGRFSNQDVIASAKKYMADDLFNKFLNDEQESFIKNALQLRKNIDSINSGKAASANAKSKNNFLKGEGLENCVREKMLLLPSATSQGYTSTIPWAIFSGGGDSGFQSYIFDK